MTRGAAKRPGGRGFDREILALALPALGALAAEPTHVLVDTAIVGHLGASDTRFLKWSMVASFAVFAPLALAAPALGLGVTGVWAALNVLMLVRLLTCGARFRGRRWAVVGASA